MLLQAQKIAQPATGHTLRKSVSDVQHNSNHLPSPFSAMEGMAKPIATFLSAVEHTGDSFPADASLKRMNAKVR